MKMIFPPSFFTVFVHLIVYLVPKAIYFDDIETSFTHPYHVDDDPSAPSTSTLFQAVEKPVGGHKYFKFTPKERLQTHRHVLNNCNEIKPFMATFLRRQHRGRACSAEIDKQFHREFSDWFTPRVCNDETNPHISQLVRPLSLGPIDHVKRFTAYNVNGFKSCTVARDEGLLTQNSGVCKTFGTRCYASSSDADMHFGHITYYGKLIDIIKLIYQLFDVTLFKCTWANMKTARAFEAQ